MLLWTVFSQNNLMTKDTIETNLGLRKTGKCFSALIYLVSLYIWIVGDGTNSDCVCFARNPIKGPTNTRQASHQSYTPSPKWILITGVYFHGNMNGIWNKTRPITHCMGTFDSVLLQAKHFKNIGVQMTRCNISLFIVRWTGNLIKKPISILKRCQISEHLQVLSFHSCPLENNDWE